MSLVEKIINYLETRDLNMSDASKLALVIMGNFSQLANRHSWVQITPSKLAAIIRCRPNSIYKIIASLIDHGAIMPITIECKGKIIRHVYIISIELNQELLNDAFRDIRRHFTIQNKAAKEVVYPNVTIIPSVKHTDLIQPTPIEEVGLENEQTAHEDGFNEILINSTEVSHVTSRDSDTGEKFSVRRKSISRESPIVDETVQFFFLGRKIEDATIPTHGKNDQKFPPMGKVEAATIPADGNFGQYLTTSHSSVILGTGKPGSLLKNSNIVSIGNYLVVEPELNEGSKLVTNLPQPEQEAGSHPLKEEKENKSNSGFAPGAALGGHGKAVPQLALIPKVPQKDPENILVDEWFKIIGQSYRPPNMELMEADYLVPARDLINTELSIEEILKILSQIRGEFMAKKMYNARKLITYAKQALPIIEGQKFEAEKRKPESRGPRGPMIDNSPALI